MEGNQSRRIDFVDLTKGVCIILVVMAHVGGAFEQLDTNSMLSCFRMPLYFFISGVFFKSYEGLFGFILRKINKLIIPFLFFYLSAFLMKYIVWKIAPGVFQLPVSWNELLVVFHGHDLIKFNPPIWFLLALFNCNILFYLIHFLREKHLPVMFAVTILIGCAGFYLGKLQIELPLYIDVSMTALPFYVAGFWIRRYNFFLYPSHRFDKLIPVFIVLALVVMYFTATTLGMRTNNYTGNIFQVYIAAFAGIFMMELTLENLSLHLYRYCWIIKENLRKYDKAFGTEYEEHFSEFGLFEKILNEDMDLLSLFFDTVQKVYVPKEFGLDD